MTEGNKIGVIGAGAWGTALAIVLNRAGAEVTLWARSARHTEGMRQSRVNQRYLPDVFIEPSITITDDLNEVVECDVLVLAIPSQSMRTMCISLADMIDTHVPLVVASKGIERGSLLLMSEVFDVTLPFNPVAVLSGPNFALEAAQGLPTATVLASRHEQLLEHLQFLMSSKYFRPYMSDDVISVQVGGALKNVIAMACGITIGAGLGENARAAIMTRGLAEMMRLAEAKGGRKETLQGLSGLGDLMLSCASEKSRNKALGMTIGKSGLSEEDDVPITPSGLAEGMLTAEAAYDLSIKLGVSMPISVAVADILKGRVSVMEGIDALLSRSYGWE